MYLAATSASLARTARAPPHGADKRAIRSRLLAGLRRALYSAFVSNSQVRNCGLDSDLGRELLASPGRGLLAAKDRARGSRFRHRSVLLVGYVALYVADRVTPPHDYSFRSELCLPDRTEEIDFQFNRSEGFPRSERTRKRDAHRSISDVA